MDSSAIIKTDMQPEISIPGWADEWLARTSPVLQGYSFTICLGVILLALIVNGKALMAVEALRKNLKANPSARASIFSRHDKRMQETCARMFALACISLCSIGVVSAVDVGISCFALTKLVADNAASLDVGYYIHLATVFAWAIVLVLSAYLIVPMAQMLLITYLLSRFSRKHSAPTLAAYIPDARFLSTHIALLWSTASFALLTWWPYDVHPWARGMLFQGALGSAIAWMDASWSFNFHADALEGIRLEGPRPGVRGIVRLFAAKVVEVHSLSKKGKAIEGALPVYRPLGN